MHAVHSPPEYAQPCSGTQFMSLRSANEEAIVLSMGDRNDYKTIARGLYACLRRFNELGVDEIYAESVSEEGLGRAIMNRLVKAAEGRIIHG